MIPVSIGTLDGIVRSTRTRPRPIRVRHRPVEPPR